MIYKNIYGGFQSIGVPQIIQVMYDLDLVLKPMVLGIPHFKKPPNVADDTCYRHHANIDLDR